MEFSGLISKFRRTMRKSETMNHHLRLSSLSQVKKDNAYDEYNYSDRPDNSKLQILRLSSNEFSKLKRDISVNISFSILSVSIGHI